MLPLMTGRCVAAAGARRAAFTLIELIVSISVGAIISGAAAMMIWNATQQRAEVSARSELCEQAAAALESMLRQLREIPQDQCPTEPTPCLEGQAQIALADQAELRFGDVGYRLNAANDSLEMTLDNGDAWYCLTREVQAFAFSYYDRQGNLLSSLPLSSGNRQAVRQVGVDLSLGRGGQDAHVRSRVYLRNFMDEVTSVP